MPVGTTGIEVLEPLALLTENGTTAFHANCTPDSVRNLVKTLESGEHPTEEADYVVDHERGIATVPLPDDGPLAVGQRSILERCGWVDPTSISGYETLVANDGEQNPDEVLETIVTLGLRGRGRGDAQMDEPIIKEWQLARETDGEPVVVVNAHEADARNCTDQTLLDGSPIEILDAATAVAYVVGAEDIVIYTNESTANHQLREAIETFAETDAASDVNLQVFSGPDMYIAGEPTMAIEAIEGNDRLEARLRPPSPAAHGLYGRPTVVHTPRTLAHVRRALRESDAFDPQDSDPGTRLMTVTGDVQASATIEIPPEGTLAIARDAVSMDGVFKMACVGGQFGGITQSLDYSPRPSTLSKAQLGTEGVAELFNEQRCVVATVGTRSKFAQEENCGRCVPCREGSKQATNLLRELYDGEYNDASLRELARTMRKTSICEFGRTATRPVTTAMNEFEPEFRAHADGHCPTGTCEEANP
ncbi:NADH-ubiquinone oxidoreductase-F iron-sulfur binding region domain-containing protein [Haladaptatus sp. NG-SE-30]